MKPILFNTEMVQKILAGTKTVTRRVVAQAHLRVLESDYRKEHPEVPEKQLIEKLCKPPFEAGEVLYVRETWATTTNGQDYLYRADADGDAVKDRSGNWHVPKWRPSLHMPRVAARIYLRVTSVHVERLQEIGAEGFFAEGMASGAAFCGDTEIAVQEFATLWNSTIKPTNLGLHGWACNPWVWVIEFERCERPEE